MALQPAPPVRGYSFTDWQVANPTAPPPGDKLDAEYDRADTTISQTISWAAVSLLTDGTIRHGVVGKPQLVSGLFDDVAQSVIDQVQPLVDQAEASAGSAFSSAGNADASASEAEAANVAAQDARTLAEVAAAGADLAKVDAQTSAAIAEVKATDAANAANHAAGDAALAEDWGVVSRDWAEHMPDTIPPNTLAVMGITGDHWSARWWAHKAGVTFGNLSEWYLGAWPEPPLTTSTGETIPVGAIYYNTISGQPFIWNGTEWVPFYAPTKALMLTLVYTATAGQTAFPLTTPDLHLNSFTINAAAPEPVDVYVNGVRLPPNAPVAGSGDWTLTPASSTVVLTTGLKAGDVVQVDVLSPASSIAPSRVQTKALLDFDINPATEAPGQIDGTRTSFPLVLAPPPHTAVGVGSPQELFVSLDGVPQQPGTDYSVSGGNIIFGEAPYPGARAWASWYGPGNPSDPGTGFLPLTGGVLSGPLTLDGSTPTVGAHAASKAYVDSQIGVGGAGPFLKLSGGIVTGLATFSGAGTGLAVTNALTVGTVATVGGTVTAGNNSAVKVQSVGGAGAGFLQTTGGRLVIQAPANFTTTLTPLGIAGTNDVININQRLDVFPFILGTPAKVAGHHMGMRVVVNDTIASDDGVWHFTVSGNIGAQMWKSLENLTNTGNLRNSGGNVYSNTSTGVCGPTPPAGTGTGISDGTVIWTYIGSDFIGNRVGVNSYLSVRGRTGPTAPAAQLQWSAASGTISISANQGGTAVDTASSTRGTIYGGGQQVWVYAGATYLTNAVGFETDLGVFNAGDRAVASVYNRIGGNFVSYGEDQGVRDDCANLYGGRNDDGLAVPWKRLFQVGEGAISTVGALKTSAIFQYRPRPPGSLLSSTVGYINPAAIVGFDLSNIDYDTSALIGPSNSGIDRVGALFAGAGRISTNTSGMTFDVEALGSVITGVTWVQGQWFKAGDQIYYPYDGVVGGLIIKILTVDGVGKPLTWTLDPAQGGRPGATLSASPPTAPLTMWGGSGGTVTVAAQFTPTWAPVRKIRIGPTAATDIEIGRTASTTLVSGKMKMAAAFVNAANDAAAASAGVGLFEFYRNGSVIMQRVV